MIKKTKSYKEAKEKVNIILVEIGILKIFLLVEFSFVLQPS